MTESGPEPVPVKVQSYAGYKAEEHPRSFSIGARTFQIDKILDRWYGPDHVTFKVRADDRKVTILRYDPLSDAWEWVFMESVSGRGVNEP